MKFFIDTANLDQIKEAQDLGVLDGVTTNPSLMAKEGITGHQNILNHYVKICEIVDGDVSAEVISTDFEGMVKEGEALAKLHPQIVVKIPMILDGVKALKYFSNKGIRTNCTLIFSVGQALIAAKAAIDGLTKCVLPLSPCLPSKFLLDVDAHLSYGNKLSSFIPKHIEQPGSLHSNPDLTNILSRPSFSASAFTRPDPGTTMACLILSETL